MANAEALGKGAQNTHPQTNVVTDSPPLSGFTEEELERMLTEKRLAKEKDLLKQASASENAHVGTVTADESVAEAVGLSPYLEMEIEGVPVTALVDSGSKCTIISRSLLHDIGKHLAMQGKPSLSLEKPCTTLYGKGGQKLHITAQVSLSITADGKSVKAPLFVEPESEQKCLLGMNVAPLLGLKFTRSNGQPLRSQSDLDRPVALVRLVGTSTVPGRKG